MVSQYIVSGNGASGTGKKAINHLQRNIEITTERKNIFLSLDDNTNSMIIEVDQGNRNSFLNSSYAWRSLKLI